MKLEIGQTIHYLGRPYVLVGMDPMSVPDRRAHLEHALSGEHISVRVTELEAKPEAEPAGRHGERGIALVMALGMLIVMSIIVGAVIDYSTANGRNSRLDTGRQKSYALAEAGINNAEAVLSQPTNNALTSTLLPSTTSTYDGGSVTWSGTLNASTSTWTITSTATVNNPAGGAAITRTLTATVLVTPNLTQPLNNQAWNYVYDWGTGNTCDMTLSQSVTVASPLYVDGNLCLQNTSTITSGPLVVKGQLTLSQAANAVGSSASPINEAHIANGCKYKNNALHNPCQWGATDNVFATIHDSTPAAISPPTIDFAGWYASASPGPNFPCDPSKSSGTLPTFDNDTTRNDSLTPAWNLTPASSYDCVTALGELGWNASTKVLTVKGVTYFDGSVYANNGALDTYTGQGTIYTSGTFSMTANNTMLCAVVSGSTCDTTNWNPNTRLLVIVSNGNGDNGLPAGDSVQLRAGSNAGYFQGGIYATNTVDISSGFQIDGPLVAKTVSLGQSVNSSFPFIDVVPQGTPGNPNTYAQPGAPSYGG